MDIGRIFSSKTRKALFGLYFADPDREYYLRELERILEIPVSMVRTELINLKKDGIFDCHQKGNLTYFYLNKSYPLFNELKNIVFKTIGTGQAVSLLKVLIFAGANGSGKTTLANTVVESSMHFVNADNIKNKRNISYLDAGKEALKIIDQHISKKTNFAFETTMSGKGLLRRLENFKKQGYEITVFYLFAYPVTLLDERVKERIKKGGHLVESEDIERRFYRSVKNFWDIYKNYANEWAVINNNEFHYKNIVVGNKKEYQIIDEFEFKKFKEVLDYGE